MRPGNPLLEPAPADAARNELKLDSAKGQFLSAMLRVQNQEDAFRAVIEYWDTPDSEPWVARAHEQLALMYLRNPDRWSEASQELAELRKVTGSYGEEFAAKSWVGEAVLAFYRRRPSEATQILSQHRTVLETHQLYPNGNPAPGEGGAWRRLSEDVRSRTQQQPGRRPEDRGPNNATL
jgi:hypothetical protein